MPTPQELGAGPELNILPWPYCCVLELSCSAQLEKELCPSNARNVTGHHNVTVVGRDIPARASFCSRAVLKEPPFFFC